MGLIAAGNIPAVGFHDLLSVFAAGHISMIKYSEKDKYLLPFLIKKLIEIDERAGAYFVEVERLADFDAVIATGSNNSSRYFKQYFGKYPHIIRSNKNSVAFLNGCETPEELKDLGSDIFQYFGLGCRSVSHIMIPIEFDFERLCKAMSAYESLAEHPKYKNNLDYHLAILILNKDPHRHLPGVVLRESDELISPVGCLNYSYYYSYDELRKKLADSRNNIQCIVGHDKILSEPVVPFGSAQRPGLADYADGVDTMEFLTNL